MKPFLTVAVIAYQSEQTIVEAIESVFRQTYEPLQIILSDDGSTDKTYEIMERMA